MKQKISIFLTICLSFFINGNIVSSAGLSNLSDVMTRQKISEGSNHTFTFTQDAGTSWANGETLTLTFASGFVLTSLLNSDPLDYDISVGGTNESIVAAGACGANDAIEITSIVGQVITFTTCSSYTTGSTGAQIIVKIGNHATVGGNGDTQITNPNTTGNKTIAIGGNFGDTGTIAVYIVTDDQINLSALVDPSITVTITGNSVDFGTLSSSTVSTGTSEFAVGTNSASGYNVTIDGDTLTHTNGIDVIDEIGNTAVVSNPGTEQFGINLRDNTSPNIGADPSGGVGAVASGFNEVDKFKFYTAGNPQIIANSATSSDLTTFTISFIANIAPQTDAGLYTTTLTIITTSLF